MMRQFGDVFEFDKRYRIEAVGAGTWRIYEWNELRQRWIVVESYVTFDEAKARIEKLLLGAHADVR